jgi:IrrE N-terminal-like domain
VSAASQPCESSAPGSAVLNGLCIRHGAATVNEALIAACRAFASAHSAGRLPLRLDLLLRAAGARREIRNLTGDGRLEMDPNGRFVVVVEAGQHWSRQRFTIAHELAHIILFSEFADDPQALRRLRSPELWSVVERACNAAAAELLMPADDVSAAVGKAGLDPLGLSELRVRYAVSWSALLVRLSEVLCVPVAVFRRHARHRSEPTQWRVHRHYGAAHGIWLPTGMTTRHLSVPVVEQASAGGVAEAELVVDVPAPTLVRALASSLVHAREIPRQEGFFEQSPPEEPARWPEVAVFLIPEGAAQGSPSRCPQPSAIGIADVQDSGGAGGDFHTLRLW